MTIQTQISGWLTGDDLARAKVIARQAIGKEALIREIANEVSQHTGIAVKELISGRRAFPDHARARWLVWSIASRRGLSATEIARVTGFDHTSILHGIKKDAEERGA